MQALDWHRVLSALLAGSYLAVTLVSDGFVQALRTAPGLLFLLACIWLPDEIGQYSGTLRLRPTPGSFVRIPSGWAQFCGSPDARIDTGR
jgi:hypothetical protein